MKNTLKTKRGDLFLIIGLLALGLIAAILIPCLLRSGNAVEVEINGERVGTYRLDDDQTVRLECGEGYNILVIRDGQAFIEDADCKCGVCVAHSPIDKDGETIICLPHKLVVRVVKESR